MLLDKKVYCVAIWMHQPFSLRTAGVYVMGPLSRTIFINLIVNMWRRKVLESVKGRWRSYQLVTVHRFLPLGKNQYCAV